jgi:hypothetical protein
LEEIERGASERKEAMQGFGSSIAEVLLDHRCQPMMNETSICCLKNIMEKSEDVAAKGHLETADVRDAAWV